LGFFRQIKAEQKKYGIMAMTRIAEVAAQAVPYLL